MKYFRLLLAACLHLICIQSGATTYNVTVTTDGHSTNQLRGAFESANASAGPHTINIAAGIYTLTLGQLFIGDVSNQSVTVSGAGASSTIIDGNNADRIIQLDQNGTATGVTFSVTGVQFTNGKESSDTYGGGAFQGYGTNDNISFTNCDFVNNSSVSSGGPGGALSVGHGTLTITNCTFSGNSNSSTADVKGGAIGYEIFSGESGVLTITGCTFTNNSASATGGAGGAISITTQGYTGSTFTLSASINKNNFISNHANTTGGEGGGIFVMNEYQNSTVTINFNRFSGNTATATGARTAVSVNNSATSSGTVNVANNWWDCNGGPTSCVDKGAVTLSSGGYGTNTFTPYLQLKTTTTASSLCPASTATITTGFTSNSVNTTIAAVNLTALTGLSVSYFPALGTLSGSQTTIQSSGTATTTYTAGSTAGSGGVNTVVDSVPNTDVTARASITVNQGTSIGTNPLSTSSCSGAQASFTVAATGGSLTYQWFKGSTQLNNGPTGTGSTISGATSSTLVITNPGSSDAATNYNVVVTGTCGSPSSTNATLTIGTTNTWTGGSSALWSNAANWSCGVVPISTVDVIIPSGTANSPQIDITTASANNLTINSGATLSFSGTTNILDVKGNLSNSGTFNASSGKVAFSGSTQNIAGLSYKDLQINGAGNKTLTGSGSVSGTLTLTNGLILLGSNNLTIGSAGSITGGSSSSFVVSNGTGKLVQQNLGTGGRTGAINFPLGAVTTSYTPVSLNNSGSPDNFSVGMLNAVYSSYDASDNPTSTALTTNAVGKTWLISEGSAGNSNVTAIFQWNAVDELSGFTRSACYGSHYMNGAWHGGATAAAGGSNPYTQTLSGITAFSPFGVGGTGSPLPVTLTSFSGRTQSSANVLEWSTDISVRPMSFEVERSEDGYSYDRIATVAIDPAREQTAYTYTDKGMRAETNFYRLKTNLSNRDFRYSNIVLLRSPAAPLTVAVGPNPFCDETRISIMGSTNSLVSVVMLDAAGRIVASQTQYISQGSSVISLSGLGHLAKGFYSLQVSCEGMREQFKMVKVE